VTTGGILDSLGNGWSSVVNLEAYLNVLKILFTPCRKKEAVPSIKNYHLSSKLDESSLFYSTVFQKPQNLALTTLLLV
jgi:hypothetical protein